MSSSSMISVRNVWKVFGPNADKLIGTPDADLSRTELRNKTGNTIAVDRKSTRLNSSHT